MMYDGVCTSIVPYVPTQVRRSRLGLIFDRRSRLYAFSFSLCLCVLFAAYVFCKRFGIFFYSLGIADDTLLYSHLKFVLLLYIIGFTVFSPVAYVMALFVYSFFCGCFMFSASTFVLRAVTVLFMFVSVLYFCEVCLCFDKTKYGIRQIFSAQRVFVFSFVTLVYLCLSFLYFSL